MEPGTFKQKHSTKKDFSTQREHFLYLPKNDKFFKRKKVSHPPEIADFPFKEHFSYLRKTKQFSKGKEIPLFAQENKFSKLKTFL